MQARGEEGHVAARVTTEFERPHGGEAPAQPPRWDSNNVPGTIRPQYLALANHLRQVCFVQKPVPCKQDLQGEHQQSQCGEVLSQVQAYHLIRCSGANTVKNSISSAAST